METPWEETHRPLLARITGAVGILLVVAMFLPGSLGGPQFDDTLTTPRLLSWVKSNIDSLPVQGFISALTSTVMVLFLLALATLSRTRGLATRLVTVALGGMLAVEWIDAAVSFALADAARRASSDSGTVALFSLSKTMTFADGFGFGLAVLVISLAALRSRALAAPVAWLGVVCGVVHLVGLPVQFALNSRPDGATGPISVVVLLVWVLAVSLVLVIRPGRTALADRVPTVAAA
jgi:hypothetical protein